MLPPPLRPAERQGIKHTEQENVAFWAQARTAAVAALEATKGPKPLPSQNAAFSAMGPPAGTGQFAAVGFSYGGDGGGVGGGDDGGGSGDEREAEEEESDEEEDAPATAGVPLLLPLPSSAYRLLCCCSCWPHLLLLAAATGLLQSIQAHA